VYLEDGLHRRDGATDAPEPQLIAGMLTQQVELGGENLEIGIVTQARFIRETVALLDVPPPAPDIKAKVAGAFATDTAAKGR
ncbi:MAG: serine protease, partial [Caulobacteraceae bacterium]